ncbi:penicillin acylase family protein [Planomonospora sp. ID67723]|uniref:penicillin acylase family protein n=1 Tax=Planomonospora sp. ID67723 TaxID=2738134 RepID=UPI0018C3843F|nr:penicillin acylase family protein [Planomonospora sp. ID67723]MBG0833471.1 penicillin acylase family protein [Planomonospora sp. ID67723]
MPRPLTWLARVLTVLVVLGLALGGVVVWNVRASFPQLAGELKVDGLVGKVTVYRDKTGIPHIYADSPEDLFLAQGYVHAQDRFFEMDFRRHVTAGRLSEMFGAATLTEDKVIRTMGWRRVAEEELPLLAEKTRHYLDAYAKGVNSWMDRNRGAAARSLEYAVMQLTNSGYEPEPWTPVDSLAWLKAMAWDLRSNMSDEIGRALAATRLPRGRVEQLWPGYPFAEHQPIVTRGSVARGRFDQDGEPRSSVTRQPDAPPAAGALARAAAAVRAVPSLMGDPAGGSGIGSNSWVVSGEHTVSGKPLLANDPHLSAALPSVWYQAGLHCRKKSAACPFDVTGFTFSGVPGVVIGRNDRIAWGFTNLGPDVADLYMEKVKDDSYLLMGQWKPLAVRTETIEVAGGGPVRLRVRDTMHGPIISDVMEGVRKALPGAIETAEDLSGDATGNIPEEAADAVALKWTALEPGRSADAIFALDAAQNWQEFRTAAASFDVPSQNLVYADVDGNIGYQAPGRIPVRAKGDGTWPVPGWSGEYAWQGTIPFDELPSLYNPPEGYIVTANNAVADPERYPHLLTRDWAYGYRSQRILDLLRDALKDGGKVDVEAMSGLQQDSRNGFAGFLVPRLMELDLAGPAKDARELLRGWDGSQGLESAPAMYFNAVWRHLLIETFNDDLPEGARPGGGDRWFEVVRVMLDREADPFWDDAGTAGRAETRDDMLRRALALAYDELSARLGPDVAAWRWGDLHSLTLTHQSLGTSGIGPVEWLFNRGPFPVSGNDDAVNAAGWDVQEDYAVGWLPSMRMVVDLADPDRSRWVNLTGASGHAFHDNYADQAPLWASGQTTPMLSREESVRKAAANTLTLLPGAAPVQAPAP